MRLKDFSSNLFLHESLHIFSGLLLAVFLYWIFRQKSLAIAGFLISFLMDIDHYFEAAVALKFNIKAIIEHRYNCWFETEIMTIFFHSWELIVLILVLGWRFNFVVLSVSISSAVFLHCLIDTFIYCLAHRMPWYQYFLFYRAFNRFNFWRLYNNGKRK